MSAIRRYNGQNWLPSLFNDFFDNDWLVKANATAPAINVIESDTDYKVEIAAPGMKKEEQTQLPQAVRQRYEAMLAAPGHAPNLEAMIENFDRALSHPDAEDLARLTEAVRA